jgi:capsule polysaccharide modification protein KpsS
MPLHIFRMRVCLIILISCLALHTHAQDSTVLYKASVIVAGATDQTPFWQHANQNGSIPMDGTFASRCRAYIKSIIQIIPSFFQWRGGIEAIGSYGKSGRVLYLTHLLPEKQELLKYWPDSIKM